MSETLWKVIGLINGEGLTKEELDSIEIEDLLNVYNDFQKIKKGILERLQFENMDEDDLKYWNSQISSFIFEGERIVNRNINRDIKALESYILAIEPIGFNADDLLKGIVIAAKIEDMKLDKNTANKVDIDISN